MPDLTSVPHETNEATTTGLFRAALIQMCSSRDVDENIATASALIREAARDGAHYIQTPEVTNLMVMRSRELFATAEPPEANRAVDAFGKLAAELGIWLHIGSMVVRLSETKCANRAFVFDPTGATVATYDKIHMFDVEVASGERYRESKNYQAGNTANAVDLPWGKLGLAICYDMRFAPLFQAYADAGCAFTCAPSAFTVATGRAHWHALLRARAIETQTFMFAAAQAGHHDCGRKTYGHSLIVSPWGEILAEGDDARVGVIAADIDLAQMTEARRKIPALNHVVEFDTRALVTGQGMSAMDRPLRLASSQ